MRTDDVFEGSDSIQGHLPWDRRERVCVGCDRATKGPCLQHALGMPRVSIPYPLDLEVDLPCVGLWEEHDEEYVTPEVKARCGSCPAAAWCLQTATENGYQGIWAGTNYDQRQGMKPGSRRAA